MEPTSEKRRAAPSGAATWLVQTAVGCILSRWHSVAVKIEQEQYLYWHPVAFKVQVDDVADLLGTTMLACHHDVQQPACWVDLQGLTHTSCQIERPGWLTFHLYMCSKCSQHAIICKLQHMQHTGCASNSPSISDSISTWDSTC